jgi:hypothetical protein
MSATARSTERPASEELREFIVDHEVCWETTVHRDRGRPGVLAVGYDVALMARCRERACDPCGPYVLALREALVDLAKAVIPDDPADDIRIAAFEPALQMRAEADWYPEVRIVVEIRHDHDYFAPIDDDERRGVKEIERALERWGAQHRVWKRTAQKRSSL